MEMTSRERVLAALCCQQPDRVPYCEMGIDRALAHQLLGWVKVESQAANLDANTYSIDEAKALASVLQMDNITYVLRPPLYVEKIPGQDGRLFYGEGLIKTEKDLDMIQLPDPRDLALYEGAKSFAQSKGPYAAFVVSRVGFFPAWISMGIENFCISLYENRPFVEAVLDLYFDWAGAVAERVCQMGFDVFVSTDDFAFKTGPFVSPTIFREVIFPRYQRIREKITLPWIVHSDGNVVSYVEDFLSLKIAGLHPNEKGAVDILEMKRNYGDRVCLMGNVDLNILGMGTPEEVEEEVRGLIRDIGPGGGYIVTSGNSLAGYLLPQNVLTMARAVQKYGRYPLEF